MRRNVTVLLSFLILFALPHGMQSQDTVRKKKESFYEVKKAAKKLEKSLTGNDDYKIARDYELLAKGFTEKNDFAKAEEYLFKSLEIYTSLKNAQGKARVTRSIAQVQESQNKINSAALNYRAAEQVATDKTSEMLNSNDFNRLKNSGNPEAEDRYLQSNINLLDKNQKKEEVADAYIQQAENSLKKSDSSNALEKYQQALPYAGNIPAKVIRIYSEIAKLHVSGKRYDEAIIVITELLEKARIIKDYDTQITQLQYLATIYFEMDDAAKAVAALKDAYKTASGAGKTFEARESLIRLITYYKSVGETEASLEMYEEFLANLDRIILSDNSLTDAKTFKVTEERIRRLESEKLLKDELINRKNTFNYVLLGSILLLLLFFGFIVRALYAIKTKNKEIALQSLRREMNPHFIFNSLNSVNQFIAQNNELEANKYLSSYSNLMRSTMENSNKNFVSLGNELENLSKYLELEHMRFKDKFDYEIDIDERLDPESIQLPNMIIQPHVENAIWHGLRYKETKGQLKLDFSLQGQMLVITIDDDGIGIKKSNELKTDNQKIHESRGLTNTRERLLLLNDLYKTNITFTITAKPEPQTGTIISINVPLTINTL